ncbi:MAG: type II toxin-antitoxin system PemK/MazF family toxin [Sulfuricaulis sp.]|nr:type II toxin-antitoxin system PemK/MazF family toxin [Sulfuricaulis sp.]
MDYDRFEVVTVPFPFTDKAQVKRRPALVLSSHAVFGRKAGHSVMAMITSAQNPPWPLDVLISDLDAAGLPAASVVRMKLFTLDHRFIVSKRGKLSEKDRKAVNRALKSALDL